MTAKSAAQKADVALPAAKQQWEEWAMKLSVDNASRKKAKSVCIMVNQAGPSIPGPESTFKIKRQHSLNIQNFSTKEKNPNST